MVDCRLFGFARRLTAPKLFQMGRALITHLSNSASSSASSRVLHGSFTIPDLENNYSSSKTLTQPAYLCISYMITSRNTYFQLYGISGKGDTHTIYQFGSRIRVTMSLSSDGLTLKFNYTYSSTGGGSSQLYNTFGYFVLYE